MANPVDHLAVLKNIETELVSIQRLLPGLAHSANTGVLPQWRLIETQTKFFDAGDRLATLAPLIKNFSANEKAKMDALFEMSNAINAKLIQVHERREAVTAKSRATQVTPVEEQAPQATTTLFEMMVAEEKIQQILAEDMKKLKADMSAKAAGKAVEQDAFFDATIKKRESYTDDDASSSVDDEDDDDLYESCDGNEDDGVGSLDHNDQPWQGTGQPGNGSPLQEEIGGVDPRHTEGFEDDNIDILADPGQPGHDSSLQEEIGGSDPTEDSEELVEESDEAVKDCVEELDEELIGTTADSDEEVEDSDEGEDGESDEDLPDEDVYQAVDLDGEEETHQGKIDMEDDGFVLIEADEAVGAPAQPWSPKERTRAKACVVM